MKKDVQQIKLLNDFSNLIDNWIKLMSEGGSKEAIRETRIIMSVKWGTVKEIFKLLNINHEGNLTGSLSKDKKVLQGDFFTDGFVGMDHYTYQVRNLRIIQSLAMNAIGKITDGIFAPINILPNLHLVINILNCFPDIVGHLRVYEAKPRKVE